VSCDLVVPSIFLAHLNKSLIIASGISLLSVRETKKKKKYTKKGEIFATFSGRRVAAEKVNRAGKCGWWGDGVLCGWGLRTFAPPPAHRSDRIYKQAKVCKQKFC